MAGGHPIWMYPPVIVLTEVRVEERNRPFLCPIRVRVSREQRCIGIMADAGKLHLVSNVAHGATPGDECPGLVDRHGLVLRPVLHQYGRHTGTQAPQPASEPGDVFLLAPGTSEEPRNARLDRLSHRLFVRGTPV